MDFSRSGVCSESRPLSIQGYQKPTKPFFNRNPNRFRPQDQDVPGMGIYQNQGYSQNRIMLRGITMFRIGRLGNTAQNLSNDKVPEQSGISANMDLMSLEMEGKNVIALLKEGVRADA